MKKGNGRSGREVAGNGESGGGQWRETGKVGKEKVMRKREQNNTGNGGDGGEGGEEGGGGKIK